MSTVLDMTGLDRVANIVASLKHIDATPLMRTWMNIINEDNRTGVLAGLDRYGVPMAPVTYRPRPLAPIRNVAHAGRKAGYHAKGIVARINKEHKDKARADRKQMFLRFRRGQAASAKKGRFAGLTGIGPDWVERNNNLTHAEYQLLSGPPLAPRGQFSRVITNLKTAFTGPPYGEPAWMAIGAWDEVVDIHGQQFLKYHFEGIGQIQRDLRGVRPAGMAKAMDAMRNWARLMIREHIAYKAAVLP